MKVEISVPEVVEIFNEVKKYPARLFDMIRGQIREKVGNYLTELMKAELTHFLGRNDYERRSEGVNHRNGSYDRNFTLKGIGEVNVKVPRDRNAEFKTQVIPKSKRYETSIKEDLCTMFLTGVSTRSLSMMSKRLIGRKISPAEVSLANKELIEAVENWRQRDLSSLSIKYLFIDGVCFPMRIKGSIQRVPVLVAIGVTEDRHKVVMGLQSGDKESASSWRQFFKDLKRRGLNSQGVTLGIMDGLPGLEKVFAEEFPMAKVQRCQVHVARNVLAKVPQKLKKDVADDIRSIFYASSKNKAMELFDAFKEKWEKHIPSAVKCLENSICSCLTFLNCPSEEWISLRTTNIIERLNKEFRRRTKSMEILAGEKACYTLLAFICLRMELHWRSNPMGKVQGNLPLFQKMLSER